MDSVYDLNLRHLTALPEIARLGSVSAACPVVHLSQPALTQALGHIETMIGHRLFERQPNGMTPTHDGELLLSRVRRAQAYLRDAGPPGQRSAALEQRLTMSHLRAVVAVAEYGNFALAAQALGLAQPSIHRAAREVEAILDQSLFLRSGRTIQLTASADRLIRVVRLVIGELQSGLTEIEELHRPGSGNIVIGTTILPRALMLPSALAQFHEANRHAVVRVIEGAYEELVVGLRSGAIDLLLGGMREPPPSSDVVQQPLFEAGLVIAARAGHPLAKIKRPTPAHLAQYPWAMPRPGSPLRGRWERMFSQAGVTPPQVSVECSSVAVIRGLLLQGGWLTVLAPEHVWIEREAGLIIEIGKPLPNSGLNIGMTTRADWLPTRTQAAMVTILQDVALRKTE